MREQLAASSQAPVVEGWGSAASQPPPRGAPDAITAKTKENNLKGKTEDKTNVSVNVNAELVRDLGPSAAFKGRGDYFTVKQAKQAEQLGARVKPQKPPIFQGISIHVNGFTSPSSIELMDLVCSHGGAHKNYYSKSSVSHIIATNLPANKINALRGEKIVHPDWIVDSCRLQRLLDWKDYQLYRNNTPSQKELPFSSSSAASASLTPISSQVKEMEKISNLKKSSLLNPLFSMVKSSGQELSQPIIDNTSSSGHIPTQSSTTPTVQWTPPKLIPLLPVPVSPQTPSISVQPKETVFVPETPSSLKKRPRDPPLGGDGCYVEVVKETPVKRVRIIEPGEPNPLEPELILKIEIPSAKVLPRPPPKPPDLPRIMPPDDSDELWTSFPGIKPAITPYFARPLVAPEEMEDQKEPQIDPPPAFDTREFIPQILEPEDAPKGTAPKMMATFRVPAKRPEPTQQQPAPPAPISTLVPAFVPAPAPISGTPAAVSASAPAPVPKGQEPSRSNKHGVKQKFYEGGIRPGTLTSTSENFVESYLSSSRLHHLSTWKMEFRNLVEEETADRPQQLQQQQAWGQLADRTIMHVDMDCFFASVALRDKPSLKEKPVGISHSKGGSKASSGVIASCNYVARGFGVKNGMFIGEAKKRCPELVFLPYEFDKYKRVSEKLYRVLISLADQIQAVSCDEALLDVSSRVMGLGGQDPELEFAREIRKKVLEETGCAASIGISHNILLAKLATRKGKPDGQFFLPNDPDVISEFIRDIPVGDLPGVGWTLKARLKVLGILTCKDLRALTKERLIREFGQKTGETLYNSARGLDQRPLVTKQQRKTVGAEVNWGMRFETTAQVQAFTRDLVKEVAKRLGEAKVKGSLVTLKVKRTQANAGDAVKFLGHGLCDSLSRSATMGSATCSPEVIYREVWALYHQLKIPDPELRGLGVHISRLEPLSSAEITQPTLQFSKIPEERLLDDPPALAATAEFTAQDERLSDGDDGDDVDGQEVVNQPAVADEIDREESSGEEEGADEDFRMAIRRSKDKGKERMATPPIADGGETDLRELSQRVDFETFQELPLDIQHEVAKTFRISDPSRPTALPPRPDSGPSSFIPSLLAPAKEDEEEGRRVISSPPFSQSALNLPPLSQLDVVTLLELPDKQRLEVLQFYAKQQQQRQQRPPSHPPPPPPPPAPLPAAPSSLRLQTSSKEAKKPRGRPKKVVAPPPKAIPPPPVPQTTTVVDIQLPSFSQVDQSVVEELPSPLRNQIKTAYQERAAQREKEKEAVEALQEEGSEAAPETADIRTILKEWISSTETPAPEDAVTVTGFLIRLIEESDLERANLALRYLCRAVKGKPGWELVVGSVVSEVRAKVQQRYGGILRLPA